MMAETQPSTLELTTADLAGQVDTPRPSEGPRLVKGQLLDASDKMMPAPLFSETELAEFRARWSTVQTGFVDEPRRTVQDADKLVASVMQRLAEGFANERSGLEKQWDQGDNVSTEALRVALQHYRSFFDRLLKL